MSAHPAPRATRAINAETAGSSGLALGPNQRGKGGRETEASIPVMAMAPQAHPMKGSAGEHSEILFRRYGGGTPKSFQLARSSTWGRVTGWSSYRALAGAEKSQVGRALAGESRLLLDTPE